MPNTVVFLWISAHALSTPLAGPDAARADVPHQGETPSPSALAALGDFGAVRGLNFVPLAAPRPLGLPPDDAPLVDSLEGELEQARTALSALEESAASARLSRIESQLLSHPHLPQAAFLMGECLALQAQAARERQPARALDFEARRRALEGPRAVAFGDRAAELEPQAAVTLALRGLAPTDTLELDGETRATSWGPNVTVVPGIHHARVWRGGHPIFAAFVEVSSEQQTLELAVPALVPCSTDDLQAAATEGSADAGRAASPIACPHWAKVRAAGSGIEVTLCAQQHCGPALLWRSQPAPPFRAIPAETARLPTWAGAALATSAVLLASGVVLWQAGAFERGRSSTVSWEYRGLNPQGFKF